MTTSVSPALRRLRLGERRESVIDVTTPDAPSNPAGTSEHLQSTITWTPPVNDGGSPVISYTASVTGDATHSCTYDVPVDPSLETDSCVITGLTDGTSYTFDVIAHNAVGDSAPATSVTVIPAAHIDGQAIYPGADLSHVDLTGADLSGLNLSGTNFTDATLVDANLTSTGLIQTNFTGADLTGATMPNVDLSSATITDDLTNGANFTDADLSGDNFNTVDLTASNFSGANLTDATFHTITDDLSDDADGSPVNFTGADLAGASFGQDSSVSPQDFTGWTFAQANLTGVSLAGFDLAGTNMAGANLTDTVLDGGDLTGTTLTGATVAGTSFSGTTLTNVVSGSLVGSPSALPANWYVISGSLFNVVAPDPPTNVQATPGDRQVDVSWTPPANDGGQPVTSYQVVATPGSASCTYDVPVSGSESDHCVVTGLVDGTGYTFTVTASNYVGPGLASNASSVAYPGPPGPTGLVAEFHGGYLDVRWHRPSSLDGAIRHIVIRVEDGSTKIAELALLRSAASRHRFSGLNNATPYTVTVLVSERVGPTDLRWSVPAIVTVTPAAATLSAPRWNKPATPSGSGGFSVSWRPALASDSSTPTYTISVYQGSTLVQTTTTTDTSASLTGLTPHGRYTVGLQASIDGGVTTSHSPHRLGAQAG